MMRQLCFGEASVKCKYKLYISLQHILCVIIINIRHQYDQAACPLITQVDKLWKVGQAIDSMTTTLYQEIPYSLVGLCQLECFISSVNESLSHCISIPAFSFEKWVLIILFQSVHTFVTFLVIVSTIYCWAKQLCRVQMYISHGVEGTGQVFCDHDQNLYCLLNASIFSSTVVHSSFKLFLTSQIGYPLNLSVYS